MDSSFQLRADGTLAGRAVSGLRRPGHIQTEIVAEPAPMFASSSSPSALDVSVRLASRALVARVSFYSASALAANYVELTCADELGNNRPARVSSSTILADGGVSFSSIVMGASQTLKIHCVRMATSRGTAEETGSPVGTSSQPMGSKTTPSPDVTVSSNVSTSDPKGLGSCCERSWRSYRRPRGTPHERWVPAAD